MKIITAVEPYDRLDDDVCVFLVGGITNCLDWQFDEPMDEDIYVHKGKKLVRKHLPLKGKEAQCRVS